MALSERALDWLLTGGFLVVVGGLVVVGWLSRERVEPPTERGRPAPELNLERLDGGTASLEDYRGQVVMLNLWATWCAPCRQEMPSMQRAYEAFRDEGFEILAVAVDRSPGERQPDGSVEGVVSEFVERYGLTFPILVDSTGATEHAWGVDMLPMTFLIDRSGRVRVREVGGRYWDREPHVTMIARLLEE